MSESQPFLPFTSHSRSRDATTWREKTAHFLESPWAHTAILALIAIDATCELADLSYTVLRPDCGVPNDQPPWLEALSHASLAITSLFMLEIPLALYAFGPSHYNPFGHVIHAGLHLFDAVIIVTSFVLEVMLRGPGQNLAGLLIILRLWRFVELIGGVAVGAGEIEEEMERRLAETQDELERVRTELSVARSENNTLRQRLQKEAKATSGPTGS